MEFKNLQLEDVIVLEDKKRKPLSTMDRSKRKGIYPYYGAQEIIDSIDDYIFDGKYILLAEDGENLKSRKKDLVKIVEGKFWLNNHAHIFKVKENVDLEYLYYYLLKLDLGEYITGSTQPKLNQENMNKIKIKLPELKIQRKISKILSNIDGKIKLNNEINNNLYEMSLNIFNDFLNNNDAELIKLEDCVEKINTGADAIQRAPIVDYDTGVRCIRIGDMTNSRNYHSWGFTKMNDKDYDNYKLIKNDIVITRTAVNGLTYMITDEERVVCNNGNIRLRVNNNYNPLYIYLNTKTKDFRYYIDRINGETSVRPNMKVEYFTSYKIKKYSLEEQDKICNVIKPLFNKINANKKENYNLEQLRDILLPKLMNGEINLDNIEI